MSEKGIHLIFQDSSKVVSTDETEFYINPEACKVFDLKWDETVYLCLLYLPRGPRLIKQQKIKTKFTIQNYLQPNSREFSNGKET